MSGLAFDLDGDGEIDDVLGATTSSFRSWTSLDQDPVASAELADGRLVWILEMATCADSDYMRISLRIGEDADEDPTNNLTGDGVLRLLEDGAIPAVGTGSLESGGLARLGTGSVPLSTFLDVGNHPGGVEWVYGWALTIEFEPYADGLLEGRFGIGLEDHESLRVYLDAGMRTLERIIAADPTCPDSCETLEAEDAFRLVDRNRDGVIERDELEVSVFMGPGPARLDLMAEYEGELVFWPRQDGWEDARAMTVVFSAVPVTVVE